jgi:Est1 DNA/RNA binding domain
LLQELCQVVGDEDEPGETPSSKDPSKRFSATARRILPGLRQYSTWLISNVSHLLALEHHEFLSVQVVEFWRVYAKSLDLLAATFQMSELPQLDYLLDEDEDTIAFVPFANASASRRYFQPGGITLKRRARDQGVERDHPSVKLLFRVRGILEDGIDLATRQV